MDKFVLDVYSLPVHYKAIEKVQKYDAAMFYCVVKKLRFGTHALNHNWGMISILLRYDKKGVGLESLDAIPKWLKLWQQDLDP